MTLMQLKYFQTVCKLGSISRASMVLNIPQPAISSAIKELEREYNVQLFEQAFYGGNGVKIVPEPQDKAVEEQVQQAGLNSEVLLKIFSNPDMVAMLKMLAKTLG